MAAEYGLDIHVQSTMANFFDYDNDGDLICILPLMKLPMDTIRSVFAKRNKAPAWSKHGQTITVMIWILF